jgi:predicted dehydrogenase
MNARKRSSNGKSIRSGGKGKVRYAVVGLGHIAQVAVLPAFQHAQDSELVALVTEDPTKARQLSKKYCLPAVYSYEQYQDCVQSGEIDAVYIALPNSMHRDYSVAASNAGIHVLCEKPMAIDEKQCEEMIRAAERNQTKLMVAYRLHFDKANLTAVELLQSRKLGEPRIFNSTFALQVQPGNIRTKRELGGGPLWDIGIYCVNAARYLFRAEPEEVFAFEATSKDRRFREIEETVSAILKFPRAELAAFSCSFGASDISAYEVVGTKGSLRADPAYEYAESLKLTIKINGKSQERSFPKSDQFAPELAYFSDCILKNREPEPSGREGLADVRIIRALYESLQSGKPVTINLPERDKRPGAAQEIHRPPVSKPELVHVAGSSAD